jgi:hypothetical protein
MPVDLSQTTYYYSGSRNTIYADEPQDDFGDDIGNDLVALTPAEFQEFSKAPPEGKFRAAGPDGKPVWKKIPGTR